MSFGAALMAMGVAKQLFHDYNVEFALFVGLATFFVYNFQRLVRIPSLSNSKRDFWLRSSPTTLKVFTLVSFLGVLSIAVNFPFKLWVLFSVLGLLSVFYVRISVWNLAKGLREIPGLKIFLIALVWSLTLVLGNVLFLKEAIEPNSIRYSLEVFLFIWLLTIPFDVRDIDFDGKLLKSLPYLLGKKVTILLAVVLAAILFALAAMQISTTTAGVFWGKMLCYALGFLSVVLAYNKQKPSDWFYSAFVDGLLIVYGLVLCHY